jgi:ATP-dependent Clp protease ATP-binding subunit ClpC
MLERFTDDGRRVVARAAETAEGLAHDHVGTGHLLLVLLDPSAGLSATVLRTAGLDAQQVRDELGQLPAAKGRRRRSGGSARVSAGAQQALAASVRESADLGVHRVDPAHILLGVLADDSNSAARIVARAGVDREELRRRTIASITDPMR